VLAEAALQWYRHTPTWHSPRAYRRPQATCGEFEEDSPTQPGVGAAAGAVRLHTVIGGVGTDLHSLLQSAPAPERRLPPASCVDPGISARFREEIN